MSRTAEGHVVQALAALVEEPGDRPLGIQRCDQLDACAAGSEHDRLDALLGHQLADLLDEAKAGYKQRQCGVEIDDDIGDVVQLGGADHAGSPDGSVSQVTGARRGAGRSSRPTLAQGRPSTRTTSAVKSLAPRSSQLPTP